MNKVITEITPLSSKDCFYLVDRYKESFDYPLTATPSLSLISWKTAKERGVS